MAEVSVIIPVHNTAPYIEKCVDSVRRQTMEDIEIILSENLSTDGSAELCDKMASIDSRIKVLHLPVAGLGYARNKALETVKSPYVGFVDSDDVIEPDMFDRLYKAAVAHKSGFVISNFIMRYPDKDVSLFVDDDEIVNCTPCQMQTLIFSEQVPNSSCTCLFTRSSFDEIKFPLDIFFEDRAILYKLAALSDVCIHIRHSFYVYYQRKNSICHTLDCNKHMDFAQVDTERLMYISKFINRYDMDMWHSIVYLQANSVIGRIKDSIPAIISEKDKKRLDKIRKQFVAVSLTCRNYISDKEILKTIFKMRYFWPVYYIMHRRWRRGDL